MQLGKLFLISLLIIGENVNKGLVLFHILLEVSPAGQILKVATKGFIVVSQVLMDAVILTVLSLVSLL